VPGATVRLSALVWEGGEPGFLLLHGAAGHAGEWSGVAAWLSPLGRVVALDLRGHGRSERHPGPTGLEALVADARATAASFDSAPIVLGQSLGGSIAIALAAHAPELVRALVVVEASPSADPSASRAVRSWLDSWPVPFASGAEAAEFFGGHTRGAAWAAGLEETEAGRIPRFDPDVVEDVTRAVAGVDLWSDWRRVACPVLVVRGGRGDVTAAETEQMTAANPRAVALRVEGAGHDVHLDEPNDFRAAVEPLARSLLGSE
jgi:pimeloyl-ACP methyl ester carboxylesterase